MKKTITFFFLLSITCCLAKAGSYKVLLQKNKELPLTVFNISFHIGSAHDPKGFEGLARLTAALLREGGVKEWESNSAKTRAEIEELLFPLATDIGVSIGKEQITFSAVTASENSERVFSLIAQMILSPNFDSAEFERLIAEASDVLEKQAPREDQEELGKAVLDRVMFGENHPYAHITHGTKKGVSAITLDKVKEFYKTTFSQNKLTVGIGGMISNELQAKAKQVFSGLPTFSEIPRIPKSARKSGTHLTLVKGPFQAVGVHLGHPVDYTRKNIEEFSRMYLAMNAFGKHRSFVGRLMNVVREERGLNYGTYAYTEDFPGGGRRLTEPTQAARSHQAFTLWARPTPLENGCFLLRQVHREVDNLSHKGLSTKEYAQIKNHLKGSIPLLAVSLDRQLGYAVDAAFYGIQGNYLRLLRGQITSSNRDEVQKLLKENIHPTDIEIVVVTPDPESFKKQILGEKCEIHYGKGVEKSKDILKEDMEISVHTVPVKEEDIHTMDSSELF